GLESHGSGTSLDVGHLCGAGGGGRAGHVDHVVMHPGAGPPVPNRKAAVYPRLRRVAAMAAVPHAAHRTAAPGGGTLAVLAPLSLPNAPRATARGLEVHRPPAPQSASAVR